MSKIDFQGFCALQGINENPFEPLFLARGLRKVPGIIQLMALKKCGKVQASFVLVISGGQQDSWTEGEVGFRSQGEQPAVLFTVSAGLLLIRWIFITPFFFLLGEEWRAEVGALFQSHLCLFCPLAADFQPFLVQCPHQVSAYLLPVGLLASSWDQFPDGPSQCL